nr:MAG TPA: hypothetical protein [Caudoviricetes sp.]
MESLQKTPFVLGLTTILTTIRLPSVLKRPFYQLFRVEARGLEPHSIPLTFRIFTGFLGVFC